MTRKKNVQRGEIDRARDELFSHIHRCGVLQASEEHQTEWMRDTIEYLGERYPDLSDNELGDLEQIGMRFCRPVIQRAEADEPDSSPDGDESVPNEAAAA